MYILEHMLVQLKWQKLPETTKSGLLCTFFVEILFCLSFLNAVNSLK